MISASPAQVAAWSFFVMFASIGHFIILVVTLCIPKLRELSLFINLEVTIGVGCLLRSMLTWTGNGTNPHPPHTMCLVNGAVTAAYLPAVGFACVGIVVRVWSQAMRVNHPNSRFLQWIGWEPMLLAIHWSGTLAFFIAATVVGAQERSRVIRGPFFCLIQSRPGLLAMFSTSLINALTMMVLSAWTVYIVVRSRRRVRAAGSSSSTQNWGLLARTIAFLITVTIGINVSLSEIIQERPSLTVHIVLALIPFLSVFVFGSQKDILILVFRRQSSQEISHTSTIGGSRPLQGSAGTGDIAVPGTGTSTPAGSRPTTARNNSYASDWEAVRLPQTVW